VYVPFEQRPVDDIYLVARRNRRGVAGTGSVGRAAIDRVDTTKLVSVTTIQTSDDIAWDATGPVRFRAVLVMTFAMLALMLAMVGVFGVLGYAVAAAFARVRRADSTRRHGPQPAGARARQRPDGWSLPVSRSVSRSRSRRRGPSRRSCSACRHSIR
jgi:hypothetical protein